MIYKKVANIISGLLWISKQTHELWPYNKA